jgi:hypothetical protein
MNLGDFQDQKAAMALGRAPVDPAAIAGWADPRWSATALQRRLAVHRRNAAGAAIEALAAAFPVTRMMIGDAAFAIFARTHLRDHPPALPQLSAWGADFPDQLAAEADLWPAVAWVARLEWARVAIWFAPETPVFHPGEAPPTRLMLRPSARVVDAPWPVQAIWAAHQPDAAMDLARAIEQGPDCVLVVRAPSGLPVHHLMPAGTGGLAGLFCPNDRGEVPALAAVVALALERRPDLDLPAALGGLISAGALGPAA